MTTKPGNGYESPFGNGKGATMAGPSTGAHDFVEDPEPHGSKEGGRDFTEESRPQKTGEPDRENVPPGGPLPYPSVDPSKEADGYPGDVGGTGRVPFKNLR